MHIDWLTEITDAEYGYLTDDGEEGGLLRIEALESAREWLTQTEEDRAMTITDDDTMQVWDRLAMLAWDRGAFVLLTAEGVETALRTMPEIAAQAAAAGYPDTLTVKTLAERASRSYYEFASRVDE